MFMSAMDLMQCIILWFRFCPWVLPVVKKKNNFKGGGVASACQDCCIAPELLQFMGNQNIIQPQGALYLFTSALIRLLRLLSSWLESTERKTTKIQPSSLSSPSSIVKMALAYLLLFQASAFHIKTCRQEGPCIRVPHRSPCLLHFPCRCLAAQERQDLGWMSRLTSTMRWALTITLLIIQESFHNLSNLFSTLNQPVLITTLKDMLISLRFTLHADMLSFMQKFSSEIQAVGSRVDHIEKKWPN